MTRRRSRVEEPWQQAELREWLGVALAKLPHEQRMVLELAYTSGTPARRSPRSCSARSIR